MFSWISKAFGSIANLGKILGIARDVKEIRTDLEQHVIQCEIQRKELNLRLDRLEDSQKKISVGLATLTGYVKGLTKTNL